MRIGKGRITKGLPPARCPHCRRDVDATISTRARSSPTPGSVTICGTCLGVSVFRDDYGLRALRDGEWEGFPEALRAEVGRLTAGLRAARGQGRPS